VAVLVALVQLKISRNQRWCAFHFLDDEVTRFQDTKQILAFADMRLFVPRVSPLRAIEQCLECAISRCQIGISPGTFTSKCATLEQQKRFVILVTRLQSRIQRQARNLKFFCWSRIHHILLLDTARHGCFRKRKGCVCWPSVGAISFSARRQQLTRKVVTLDPLGYHFIIHWETACRPLHGTVLCILLLTGTVIGRHLVSNEITSN
jgi:hypothetical protein